MRESKQEIRDSEARQLSVQMKRLITGYRTLLETALEEQGITLAQLRMLHALDEQPDASAAELARTCFITPQSMQAVVQRAEREGWIVRRPSAENRRVLTAMFTAAGRRVLQRGTDIAAGIGRTVWSGTKLSEMQAVNHVLAQAVSQMQPSLDALHARNRASGRSAIRTARDVPGEQKSLV